MSHQQRRMTMHSMIPAIPALSVANRSFVDLCVYEDTVYWTERNPQTQGCLVVFSYHAERGNTLKSIWQETNEPVGDSAATTPFDVATDAYGYGGGAFAVAHGSLYFTCKKNGGLYKKTLKVSPDHPTVAEKFLTVPQDVEILWTCLTPHPQNADVLFAVCVVAGRPGLAYVNAKQNTYTIFSGPKNSQGLKEEADFYIDLCLNPEGNQLCWLQGSDPHMPWDQSALWTARVNIEAFTNTHAQENVCENIRCLYEAPGVSLYQPQWSLGVAGEPSALFVCADKTGFWKLYRVDETLGLVPWVLLENSAECGRAAWIAGTKTYGFYSHALGESVVFSQSCQGLWQTFEQNIFTPNPLARQSSQNVDGPPQPVATNLEHIKNMRVGQNVVAFLGGSSLEPLGIYVFDRRLGAVPNGPRAVCVRSSFAGQENSQKENTVVPQNFSFTSAGDLVHALLYSPRTKGPWPCIVRAHGGPTAASERLWDARIQHYVNLGYAWVDLDYRGSVGYGRTYREKLKGQWGVLDVDDMVACAQALVDAGMAQPQGCVAAGNSSGGLTALMALLKSPHYACASVSYPVTDLWALREETHRFEKAYVEVLLGLSKVFPAHEENFKKHLQQRSPAGVLSQRKNDLAGQEKSPSKFSQKVIFFHGKKDRVVDVRQSIECAQVLQESGFLCESHFFEDEGHGFKDPQTIGAQLHFESQFLFKYIGQE